jgi:hypothetical protein
LPFQLFVNVFAVTKCSLVKQHAAMKPGGDERSLNGR